MEERNYVKKIFGNSVWLITAKMTNIVIGLAVSICVTRYLGAEQKGAMADSGAIAAFWGFISSFGLLDIIISKFSNDRKNSGKIAATGMTMMFCSGVVAFVLAILSALILGVQRDVLIYVAISAFVYIFQCLSI